MDRELAILGQNRLTIVVGVGTDARARHSAGVCLAVGGADCLVTCSAFPRCGVGARAHTRRSAVSVDTRAAHRRVAQLTVVLAEVSAVACSRCGTRAIETSSAANGICDDRGMRT